MEGIVIPKIINFCQNCENEIELELVFAKLSNFLEKRLLTTYRCPICKEPHYDNEKILTLKELA